MDKVLHLRVEAILRRTICEGNMDKVGHLRGNDFKAYCCWRSRRIW